MYYGERDGVPYVAHLTCRGLRRPAVLTLYYSPQSFIFLKQVQESARTVRILNKSTHSLEMASSVFWNKLLEINVLLSAIKKTKQILNIIYITLLMCLFVRFGLQAAALWPSSEVRGQTGSSGAAGEKIQGNWLRKRKISWTNAVKNNKSLWSWWISLGHVSGQQHVGRLVLGQRLPQRGEAGHRRLDGTRGDIWYPVS